MLLGGDEFGRTQGGNNNAYCQDNDISWLDWGDGPGGSGSADGIALSHFIARASAARRAHPTLRSASFLHGQDEPLPGIPDVSWFDERGEPLTPEGWHDPQGRLLVLRRAARTDAGVEVSLLLLNGGEEDRAVTLPLPALPWISVLDSAEPLAEERVVQTAIEALPRHSARLLVAIVAQEDQA